MTTPTCRLVLFFDGTDNTPKDCTNVCRSHDLLLARDSKGIPQRKKYLQGVGTEFGSWASGSIFGNGVARKIREGYSWLVENYEDGAEIYVFGFSRGAFSARSLVQMVATCGLTRPEALREWSVDASFDYYEALSKQLEEKMHPIWRLRYWQRHPQEAPKGWLPTKDETRLNDDSKVRDVKIRMAGLWDTVGSLGTDGLTNEDARKQKSAAHNVRPTKAQEYGYHALAIDEHRPLFEATLWRTFVEATKGKETMERYAQYYEQRWFIGAHSDVGGGYADSKRLPDFSLHWMLSKAKGLGLEFSSFPAPPMDSCRDPIHDSFKSFAHGILSIWDKLIPGDQHHQREIGRRPKDIDTARGIKGSLWSINETIDESVLQRWQEDSTYRPAGLEDYFRRNPTKRPVV